MQAVNSPLVLHYQCKCQHKAKVNSIIVLLRKSLCLCAWKVLGGDVDKDCLWYTASPSVRVSPLTCSLLSFSQTPWPTAFLRGPEAQGSSGIPGLNYTFEVIGYQKYPSISPFRNKSLVYLIMKDPTLQEVS